MYVVVCVVFCTGHNIGIKGTMLSWKEQGFPHHYFGTCIKCLFDFDEGNFTINTLGSCSWRYIQSFYMPIPCIDAHRKIIKVDILKTQLQLIILTLVLLANRSNVFQTPDSSRNQQMSQSSSFQLSSSVPKSFFSRQNVRNQIPAGWKKPEETPPQRPTTFTDPKK